MSFRFVEDADLSDVTAAVGRLYESASLNRPPVVLTLSSPFESVEAYALLTIEKNASASEAAWRRSKSNLWQAIQRQLQEQLHPDNAEAFWHTCAASDQSSRAFNLRHDLEEQLCCAMIKQLGIKTWKCLSADFGSGGIESDFFVAGIYGSLDSAWLKTYEVAEGIGFKIDDKLIAMRKVYQDFIDHELWLFPFDCMALVSRPPNIMHTDTRNVNAYVGNIEFILIDDQTSGARLVPIGPAKLA